MANNRIQIKRTSITGRAANTTTLTQPGELALNMTDGIMYSTNGSVVFEVGANNTSQRVTGTLTVNAVSANGGVGTNGQFLTSNGSTVYWSTPGTAVNAQQNIFTYTLAANASVIQGADDAAQTLSYTAGLESVFINGSRQILGVDYATTNSTAITLVDPALTGEVVQIVTWAGQVNTVNVNAQFAWTNTHSFSNTITFTGGINANGTVGTAGQILSSNGSTVYWSNPATGDITSVVAGDGLTGGGTSGDVTLNVVAANGINVAADAVGVVTGSTLTVNTTGIHVNTTNLSIATSQLTGDVALGTNTSGNYVATIAAANGISGSSSSEGGAATIGVVTGSTLTVNTTGIHVNTGNLSIATSQLTGDVALGANTSGNYVATISAANGISGSSSTEGGAATIGVVTGSTLTVNTTGIHVNSNLSIADLTVSGNLTVSGTRTYVNTTTLDVGDNIITLNADLGAVAPSENAGLEVMRGTSANVQFIWDETNDRWSTNSQPLAISSLVAAGAASGITTLAAGNTTITGFANVTSTLQVGGGSTFGGTVTLGSVGLSANGSLGTAGQVLHSNGTSTYWAADDNAGGTVTSIATANGLTGGTITTTGTLGVATGSTLTVNTTGIHVNSALAITSIDAASLTVGTNVIANTTQVTSNVNMLINNNKHLRFQTVNSSAYAYFVQQNDDNFVFYTSNTTYGQRAVWSVFANSITSTMRMDVPIYPIAGITANGAIGTAGQVLKSNGAGIFWDTSGGTGTVTSVATGNGLTGGTITTTGTLSVTGGSTLTVNTTGVHVNSVLSLDRILTSNNGGGTNMAVGDDAWFGDINTADTVSIRGQQSANNGYIVFGNADTTTKLGRTGAGPLTYNGAFAATGNLSVSTINATSYGATLTSNATTAVLTIGNSSVSATVNSTWFSGTSANADLLDGQHGAYYTNATNITTGTLPYAQIPANVINTTAAFTRTGITTFSANVVLGTSGVSANGGFGTDGHVLHSNGTATYWAADDQGVTSVATGNGLSGGTITTTGTLSVTAGIGIASNSTGVHVVAGNGTIVSNATGVYVNASALSIATSQLTGDVALGTSTSGNYVATISNANGISGSSSAEGGTPTIGVVTGSTLTVNTTGIHVNSALSIASLGLTGDLTVSGNLTVSGTRTYVNTTTLDIGDNIFTLNADLGAVAPSQDAGIEIMRGTSANVQFIWDETNDRWSTNSQPLAVSSLVAAGAASGITTLAAGNTTVTGFANVTTTLQVGGVSTFGGTVTLGSSGLSANGGLGTAGQVLHSNGTAAYWATDDGSVTSIATANGLTGGTITTTGTLGVASGSTLTVNTTGIHVNSTLSITSLTLAGALSGVTTAAMGNTTHTGWVTASSARGGVATPTAGQNNSALYVTNSDTNYGMLFGVDPATGRGWIQSQRTDGTATTYSLRLNPAGGITEFGAGYTEAEVANTAATGTWTMDCAAANFFDLTLTGSITISPSNVPANGRVWSGTIAAKQDATGGRTITWPTGIKWPGGSAPPATTSANATDIWSLMTYDGGSTWVGSLSVKGVA